MGEPERMPHPAARGIRISASALTPTGPRPPNVARMTAPNHCDFSANDFEAIALESSDVRLIRVTGSGLCPSAGWELRLVAANPGVVPHPESLWLELREEPSIRSTKAVTPTEVEVLVEDSHAEEVEIRFGWRQGFSLPVVSTAPTRRHSGSGMQRRADAAAGAAR
jgi:hypothetical protein